MILKIQYKREWETQTQETEDFCTEMIPNIEKIEIDDNSIIISKKSGEEMILLKSSVVKNEMEYKVVSVYLMNNEGKTIEKIK